MKSKRLMEMESYIIAHGSASMEELRDHFGVSMNTVRRDVAELLQTGHVRKVYGGVCAEPNNVQQLVPYEDRLNTPDDAKRTIGKRAASLVRDGDIIFVDSGTTTTHIMNGLRDLNVTIITNNLEVVNQGLDNPRNRIIVLPGELHRRTHSTASDLSIEYLKRFNITTAFMAATGVSASGVTNSSPLEYAIKKTAVQIAGKTVLMVTSNKFGITSLLTYASLDQLDLVITDSGITEKYRQLLAASHTALDTVVF